MCEGKKNLCDGAKARSTCDIVPSSNARVSSWTFGPITSDAAVRLSASNQDISARIRSSCAWLRVVRRSGGHASHEGVVVLLHRIFFHV